jgi:hypothetical protein
MVQGEAVSFANTTSYASYRIVFPTVKDAAAANSMQIAGIQLFDSAVSENADFNGDGDVDGVDFLIWQRGFGGGTSLQQGDANGSGTVDAADLAIWKAAFGSTAVAAAGSVPEPSSALLALLVVGTTVVAARRSTHRHAEE